MADHDIKYGLMLDYINGSLPDPLQIMVASHVAMNKDAEADFQALSEIGGDILASDAPVALSGVDMDRLLDDLDSIPQESGAFDDDETIVDLKAIYGRTRKVEGDYAPVLPAPLRAQIGGELESIEWRKVGGGVKEFVLPVSEKGLKASLLWVEAGRKIPNHTHKGREYTLILGGAFVDGDTRLDRGDFVCNDGDDVHSPEADMDHGCLCYVVQDAPLKFKGLLGLLINPFLKV